MKIYVFSVILFLCFLTACANSSQPSPLDKAAQTIENAIEKEGYEKQRQTEVYDFTFEDENDNRMVYYICLTTYYTEQPAETALDTDALWAVVSPDTVRLHKELTIEGHPAAYYQGQDQMYLCCTSTQEATVILQYDPDAVSEDTAFRVIQSIFLPISTGQSAS